MKAIEIALKSGEDIDWFLEYINNYYRAITMVSYESVKDQLNLLGISLVSVADGAFYQRGGTENTKGRFKRHLNELFSRRNIIAHQSDRAHTDAQVNIITKEIVQNFICDIEKIVRAIDAEATNIAIIQQSEMRVQDRNGKWRKCNRDKIAAEKRRKLNKYV